MALRQCYTDSESLPMSVFVPGITQEQLDTVLIDNISFRLIDVLCTQKAKTDTGMVNHLGSLGTDPQIFFSKLNTPDIFLQIQAKICHLRGPWG